MARQFAVYDAVERRLHCCPAVDHSPIFYVAWPPFDDARDCAAARVPAAPA